MSVKHACVKKHANFTLKARAIKQKGLTNTDDLNKIIKDTVCDLNTKECMYGQCDICINKKVSFDVNKMKGDVKYYEWNRKKEKYEKDGKMLKAFKNKKEEINEDAKILIAKFENHMNTFKNMFSSSMLNFVIFANVWRTYSLVRLF